MKYVEVYKISIRLWDNKDWQIYSNYRKASKQNKNVNFHQTKAQQIWLLDKWASTNKDNQHI